MLRPKKYILFPGSTPMKGGSGVSWVSRVSQVWRVSRVVGQLWVHIIILSHLSLGNESSRDHSVNFPRR